ncbi:MAG: zinc-ribbon domain-containing protein [Candidatus Omnitrophica bacterium]|nr:zinc-ribbon domain-containing protein [Candidatus Omnitrophota bacterium]
MICPNCKSEIKDNDSDFCPYCGNYIREKLTEYYRNEIKEMLDKIFIKKEKKLRKKNKKRNRE